MGRLAGFRYREIVKRLKRVGFEFDRRQREVTRFGTILLRDVIQRYRIIQGKCQRERYGLYLSKPG